MTTDKLSTLYIGVDPGRLLGWSALLIPDGVDDPIAAAHWVGSGVITGKAPRKGESRADAWARHYEDIYDAWREVIFSGIAAHRLVFVVENPSDAKSNWRHGKKGGVGTANKHTLGMRFGFILAAARQLRARAIYEYNVTKTKTRPGWYPTDRTGNLVHPMAQDRVEWLLKKRICGIHGAPLTQSEMARVTTDEAMSFGVLAYHLETGRKL